MYNAKTVSLKNATKQITTSNDGRIPKSTEA